MKNLSNIILKFVASVVTICNLPLCFAETSYQNWQTILLQDGGTIKLSPDFSAIDSFFGLEKVNNDNTATYSQRLLNAKGVRNNVVCSIKLQRIWKENINGDLLSEFSPKEFLQKYTQKQLDAVTTIEPCTIYIPIKFEQYDNVLFCRYSLLLNDGKSRLDGFSCYNHGFLFYGSSAYQRTEEEYWSYTFTDILKAWKQGELRDKTKAVSETLYKNSDIWQDHELDGGSVISLPKNWLCIYKNSKPEKEDIATDLYTAYIQILMNARPSLYDGDSSTFQLSRFFLKNNSNNKIEGIEPEDLSDLDKELVDGLIEELTDSSQTKIVSQPTIYKHSNKKIMARTYSATYSFTTNYIKTYTFVYNGSLYFLILNHKEKDNNLWDDLIIKIFQRWKLPSKSDTLPIPEKHDRLSDYNKAVSPFVYINHQHHFSLRLPSNWIQIPEVNLKESIAAIKINSNSSTSYQYIAGFQESSHTLITYPYFLIQAINTEGASSSMLEDFLSSEQGKNTFQQKFTESKDAMKEIVDIFSLNTSILDRERHIIFNNITTDIVGIGKVQCLSAGFIGKELIVWLHFYALESTFNLYKSKYFDQIIDSFEYDIPYRLKNISGTTSDNISYTVSHVQQDIQSPSLETETKGNIMEELLGEQWLITFILSVIITWGIGLTPPILIRYALLRRPISKIVAIIVVACFWFINITIFISLGSQSKTHSALFLVACASYYILHKGYNLLEQQKNIQKKNVPDRNTEGIPLMSGRVEKCSHCKTTIGKLESSFEYEGNIFCDDCYKRLNESK